MENAKLNVGKSRSTVKRMYKVRSSSRINLPFSSIILFYFMRVVHTTVPCLYFIYIMEEHTCNMSYVLKRNASIARMHTVYCKHREFLKIISYKFIFLINLILCYNMGLLPD